MKIRVKFCKRGATKFIGHLDTMRYFQKAIRRAGIDICYSAGFSPHQVMSFASPLGIGITSDGEYFDIEVNSSMPSRDAIAALNAQMAEGFSVCGYRLLPDGSKNAMSIVSAASYELFFKEGQVPPASAREFADGKARFFDEPGEVIIKKEGKGGEREVDIKRLVYDFRIGEREDAGGKKPFFCLALSAGSRENLRPELVAEAFFSSMGIPYDGNALQVHRTDIYAGGPQDAARDAAQGTAQDTLQDALHPALRGASCGLQDAARDVAQDTAHDAMQDVSQDGRPQDAAHDAMQGDTPRDRLARLGWVSLGDMGEEIAP